MIIQHIILNAENKINKYAIHIPGKPRRRINDKNSCQMDFLNFEGFTNLQFGIITNLNEYDIQNRITRVQNYIDIKYFVFVKVKLRKPIVQSLFL